MAEFFQVWFSFVGVLATLALALVGFFAWRAWRRRRDSQPYVDRQRERRKFWGNE
jgi:hypothetical protein